MAKPVNDAPNAISRGDTRVVLEAGKTWTFASALDWPGWCRRGKGDEDAALQALIEYADRYALAAGTGFTPGEPVIVDRLAGGGTTDFGVPDKVSRLEHDPLEPAEAERLAGLLESCWRRFDEVVAGAPEHLRKGPRGGGRDRDAIVEHVQEAERHYARQIAVRLPPRTPWPDQRTALLTKLTAAPTDTKWPARYAFRRIGWHVLDHAWEIEDKSD